MANAISLREQETVLFEGDAVLLKSKLNVASTHAVITNQRLFIADGSRVVEKQDLASAVEEKHGLDRKVVFTLRDGSAVAMTGANTAGFIAAANVLAGQADISSMPKAPAVTAVKNGTAWLAAFGPLIAGFITLIIGTMMWGDMNHWRTAQELQALLLRVALIYLFLRIDYLKLQSQGYSVKKMGLADPFTFPAYLFSRAKVFKQGKAPAIVWCVLVAVDVFLYLGG